MMLGSRRYLRGLGDELSGQDLSDIFMGSTGVYIPPEVFQTGEPIPGTAVDFASSPLPSSLPIDFASSPLPTTLTPLPPDTFSFTGPLQEDYSQILAQQTQQAKANADAASKNVAALTAAGASVAQIALATQQLSAANSALSKAQQAQRVQSLPVASGCAINIIPGICDKYVYIGGAALGAFFFVLAMSGGGKR